MHPLFIAGFLVGLTAVIAAVGKAMSGRAPKLSSGVYLAIVVLAAIAAGISTYGYTYFANSNTRFHGWPIPTVVFQRADADAPWLDFVGPTVILAYPMNLTLFLFVPSLLFLVWARLKRRPETHAEQAAGGRP